MHSTFDGVQPVGVEGDAGVDKRAGQAGGGGEGLTQRGSSGPLQQFGRVFAGRDDEVAGIVATGGELPEDAPGGLLSGPVGVGGDDDPGLSLAEEWAQCIGLRVGEGGAQWGDADVVSVAGEGDCERVEGAFDDDRDGAGGQFSGSSVRPYSS